MFSESGSLLGSYVLKHHLCVFGHPYRVQHALRVLSCLWVCDYNRCNLLKEMKKGKQEHDLRVTSAVMPAERCNYVWIEISALVSLESYSKVPCSRGPCTCKCSRWCWRQLTLPELHLLCCNTLLHVI